MDEGAMTKGEFAQTLREAAEVLSALADAVEERMGRFGRDGFSTAPLERRSR